MAIEYPEATIIVRQMRDVLPGRKVKTVHIKDENSSVVKWGFVNLHKVDITGERVNAVSQFGDYIFIEMDRHMLMFGDMIGKILYHRSGEDRLPKSAVVVELDDGAGFSYNPSLYGFCSAIEPEAKAKHAKAAWVQWHDAAFTPDYLARVWADPMRKIAKQMNVFNVEYKVAGIGNGYWQEILYLAGVHPQRKAKDITRAEIDKLYGFSRQVIANALDKHGSEDEMDFYGARGGYTRVMGGKLKGQPCPKCGTLIEGKSILGANVYFCPGCQK